MRKILLILLLTILISEIGWSVKISSEDINVQINPDGSSSWIVNIEYPHTTDRSDLFILADVYDVNVYSEGRPLNCSIEKVSLGTSVICRNFYGRKISYEFNAYGTVSRKGELNIFSYSYPITNIINQFNVTVKLPPGYGLVEKEKVSKFGLLPFKPPEGVEGSDGRHILVHWSFENPELGKSIEVSIIYEKLGFISTIYSNALFIGVLIIIVILLVGLIKYKKSKVNELLPVLDMAERKVMEIIIREKKPINQKKIVKELGFSKAKVSRIVKTLESKKLIVVERRGRNNIIKLKK